MRRGNFDSAHEDGDGASVTSGGSSKRSWSVNRPSAIERMRDPPTSPPHARGGGQAPISESGRTDSSTGSWMRRGQFVPRLPALIGTPPIYNPIVPSPRDRIPAPRLTRPFSLDSPSRRHHRQGTHRGHRRHVRDRLPRAPAARFRQLHATPRRPRREPIPTDSSSQKMPDSRSRPNQRRWRASRSSSPPPRLRSTNATNATPRHNENARPRRTRGSWTKRTGSEMR